MTERQPPIHPQSPDSGQERIKAKVLIADDESILLKLYEKIFNLAGYRVEIVENGQLLLERLAKDKYDLVFTDHDMPTMTGLQALNQIRDKYNLRNLPVIVCSATYEVREEVTSLGGIFLKKPATREEIIATAELALKDSQ